MKKNLRINIYLLLIVVFSSFNFTSCKTTNSTTKVPWYQVQLTTDTSKLRGLKEIGKISAKSSHSYDIGLKTGIQVNGKAGEDAEQNLKMKAAKKGARVVYITNKYGDIGLLDSWSYKVKIEGIMYK